MSIRWALSCGIICLLLLMALSQIVLLFVLQNRIEQQVTEQTTEITQVVLAQTANQLEKLALPPSPPNAPTVTISPALKPRIEIIELEHNGQKLDVSTLNNPLWQVELARAEAQRIRLQIQPEQIRQRLAQIRQNQHAALTSPVIAEFSRYTMLLIISSTLLAMLIALGLGHRLIKPLQQLVQGFRALQQGKLGQQITVSGLQEYRYVAEQFNQTSLQLAVLAQKTAELQQQQHLAELGEISRGMVHALRNPLHTLTLLLEQVANSEDPQLRQRLSEQAEHKMQHINRSLTAMLTLSCTEIDRSKPVSIKAVLQDLLLEFSNDQRLFQLQGDIDTYLPAAETELRTMLHTLLANAVEASAAHSTIWITVLDTPQQLQFRVQDQGSGLDPAIQAMLFNPHCSTKAEGAGMGLYLCSRLVKLYYQGNVTLENHPQGGCIATLNLNREITHG